MPKETAQSISTRFMKEYALYVAYSRALSYLDLKPVQRRVLWSMIQLGARHHKGYKKSSTIVGQTIKYHPHGSGSIYSAMVNMVQSPNALIEGRGNWGISIYGDPPAAERYTDCRTSELFEAIIDDIALVPYVDSYDGSDKEPVIIPTRFPIPLITGSTGIGVGIMSVLPAYHFSYVQNRLLKAIAGFDDSSPIIYAYRGIENKDMLFPKIQMIADVKKVNPTFIVTELPIGVSIKPLLESTTFTELVRAQLIKFSDEGKLNNTRLVFETSHYLFCNFILKFLTRKITEGFYFINNRILKSVDSYINEWIKWRIAYIRNKRLIYAVQDNLDVLKNNVLIELNKVSLTHKNFDDYIDDVVNEKYVSFRETIPNEADNIPTLEEVSSTIKGMSISRINKSVIPMSYIKIIVTPDDEIKSIMTHEIQHLNPKLFTKESVKKAVSYTANEEKIKKYIAVNGTKVIVSFKQIPRVRNFETMSPILFYENGTVQSLDNLEVGEYEILDNARVVGFAIAELPSVILTKDNRISIRSKGYNMNVELKSVFPLTPTLKTTTGIITDKQLLKKYGRNLKSLEYDYLYYV